MTKRRIGLFMMLVGLLAALAGLGLGGYNLWDDQRAGTEAEAVLQVLVQHQDEATETAQNGDVEVSPQLPPDPDRELPVLEVDGRRYIGTVTIPAIDVALPVQEAWDLALLKTSPCRYMGSPYRSDLIICAHNYTTHFGRLKNLLPGDEVLFTDVEGSEFRYTVAEMETLSGTAVEEMENGGWDLTLFTCTLGGQTRVTVRCNLLENTQV